MTHWEPQPPRRKSRPSSGSAKTAGTQLLDAFGYYLYDIDGQPGSARLGKQVVNWGESTFIQGGLNVINPFNLAALRRPGSEVKDALVPVNLFYFTQRKAAADGR